MSIQPDGNMPDWYYKMSNKKGTPTTNYTLEQLKYGEVVGDKGPTGKPWVSDVELLGQSEAYKDALSLGETEKANGIARGLIKNAMKTHDVVIHGKVNPEIGKPGEWVSTERQLNKYYPPSELGYGVTEAGKLAGPSGKEVKTVSEILGKSNAYKLAMQSDNPQQASNIANQLIKHNMKYYDVLDDSRSNEFFYKDAEAVNYANPDSITLANAGNESAALSTPAYHKLASESNKQGYELHEAWAEDAENQRIEEQLQKALQAEKDTSLEKAAAKGLSGVEESPDAAITAASTGWDEAAAAAGVLSDIVGFGGLLYSTYNDDKFLYTHESDVAKGKNHGGMSSDWHERLDDQRVYWDPYNNNRFYVSEGQNPGYELDEDTHYQAEQYESQRRPAKGKWVLDENNGLLHWEGEDAKKGIGVYFPKPDESEVQRSKFLHSQKQKENYDKHQLEKAFETQDKQTPTMAAGGGKKPYRPTPHGNHVSNVDAQVYSANQTGIARPAGVAEEYDYATDMMGYYDQGGKFIPTTNKKMGWNKSSSSGGDKIVGVSSSSSKPTTPPTINNHPPGIKPNVIYNRPTSTKTITPTTQPSAPKGGTQAPSTPKQPLSQPQKQEAGAPSQAAASPNVQQAQPSSSSSSGGKSKTGMMPTTPSQEFVAEVNADIGYLTQRAKGYHPYARPGGPQVMIPTTYGYNRFSLLRK